MPLELSSLKKPIDKIIITDDLSTLELHMDPQLTLDKALFVARAQVDREIASHLVDFNGRSSRDRLTCIGGYDVELRLKNLKREFPTITSWTKEDGIKALGMVHSLQVTIKKLQEAGYLSIDQLESANTYFNENITHIREKRLTEQSKHQPVLQDVTALQDVVNAHNIRTCLTKLNKSQEVSEPSWHTLRIIDDLINYHGNFNRIGANLLYLLLNERVFTDSDYDQFPGLRNFVERVNLFIDKHRETLHEAIEADMPRCAVWYQTLYADYKAGLFNTLSDPKTYGPVTNMAAMKCTITPVKKTPSSLQALDESRPAQTKDEAGSISTSEYFRQLLEISSKEKLANALQENPHLMTRQDEHGRTLLHYFISMACKRWSLHCDDLMSVLLGCPHIDVAIKDNDGCTALHQCVKACQNNVDIARKVLPLLLRKALEIHFDFTMRDEKTGKTVLQLATMTSCRFRSYGLDTITTQNLDLTKIVLDNTANAAINAYSATGGTAFYYAVYFGNFDRAHTLLQAGANPQLGNETHNPLAFVQKIIQEINAQKETLSVSSEIADAKLTELERIQAAILLTHHPEHSTDATLTSFFSA